MQESNIKLFLKNFLLTGIPFGFIMAIIYIFKDGLLLGATHGVISGTFFGFFMSLFTLYQRKRAKKKIPDHLDSTSIIYDGASNHFKGIEGVGGWLYLTSEFLFFKSHKLNIQNHETKIFISDIVNIKTGKSLGIIPNVIILETVDGEVEKFNVNNRKLWLEHINKLVK